MPLLLNHDYELLVGSTRSDTGLAFKDHDFEFVVLKDVDGTVTLKCRIANMDPQDYSKIESFGDQVSIILKAGYKSDVTSQIFMGNATEVFTTTEDLDHYVNFNATASELGLTESYSSISLPSDGTVKATRRAAIKALVADLASSIKQNLDGIPLAIQDRNLQGLHMDDTFESGFYFTGSTEAGLDWLLNSINYRWFIDDGQFYALPKVFSLDNAALPGSLNISYKLSASSGLYEVEKRSSKASEGVKLILRCALLNKVRLGGRVEVDDPALSGVFKIDRIKTQGDYSGEDWDTTLEVSAEEKEPAKLI